MPESVWRPLPPLRDTDSVTALALKGDLALAGTAAGLFRRDAHVWRRLSLAATEIKAIVIDGEVVAAGTGSAVDVSGDGANIWTRGDLETDARVTALGIAGNVLLAGTDRDGAFLSTNSGKSWSRAGLDGHMVLAIHGDKLAGTDQGLWQRQTGSSWRKLPLEGVITALARAGKAILAGTEEDGVYRSTDGGATWQPCSGVAEGINALAASGDRVVAGTSVGKVFLSTDAGADWSELPPLPTAIMAVAVDGDHILAGSYRSGLAELSGSQWRPANEGLESTNMIDLIWTAGGLLAVALDGLRGLRDGGWQPVDAGVPGDVRAAVAAGDQLILATTEGLFAGADKVAGLTDVSLIRRAPNGDLAVLTEDALHLRLGDKWAQLPRSERERTIDAIFSPAYPDDDGLLLCTLRQGTRTSVVRYGPRSQEVDRLFDYDARSRWLAVAVPPDYRVDTRRPGAFFAGTGGSLFRPSWPGDTWQRDILHDPDAIVLSMALSPRWAEDRTVAVGATTGAVITHNAGLLWTTLDEGLDDRRCLKMLYAPDGRLFCLTPTKLYELSPD